jgi:Protein of unknown function (DUF992)
MENLPMKIKLAALGVVAALVISALPAQAGGIKVGVLKCHIDGGAGWIVGSNKDADCTFKGVGGRREHYKGSITRLGVDVGLTTDTVLGWIVFAPGKLKKGSLKGGYTGIGAEATVGLGLGANALVGGFRQSINLQPLSAQAQVGLNVAAGITNLTLTSHN